MVINPSNLDSGEKVSPSNEKATLELLEYGDIVTCERMPSGSNYIFMTYVQDSSGQAARAIYKPRDGEVPLWDFPPGTLYKREYASYLLSKILGWRFIPDTVIRQGPYGIGSLQLYVGHDGNSYYSAIRETHREELEAIACFDIIANNADRKADHCFRDHDGRIWGIDHGLTFNHVLKVRTVIWDFWGESLSPSLQQSMNSLIADVKAPTGILKDLLELLQPIEVEALSQRVDWLASLQGFPELRR